MAELAAGMRRLRGFLHVSTAYVNSNFPRGSHVEERMYPLGLADGRTVDHAAIAAELLALPPASAERQACPRSVACYAKVVTVSAFSAIAGALPNFRSAAPLVYASKGSLVC